MGAKKESAEKRTLTIKDRPVVKEERKTPGKETGLRMRSCERCAIRGRTGQGEEGNGVKRVSLPQRITMAAKGNERLSRRVQKRGKQVPRKEPPLALHYESTVLEGSFERGHRKRVRARLLKQ